MKRIIGTVVLLGLVVTGLLWAVSQNRVDNDAIGKLTVSATYYPLYEFARQVGGDKVQVVNMTPAGAEPHDYEPSPKDLVDASRSDVFVYNGGHLEPWVEGFLHDYQHIAVKASQDIDLRIAEDDDEPGEQVQDPHFWLDPLLAKGIVFTIRDALVQADPANGAYYEARAQAYSTELDRLDRDYQQGLADCQTRTLITAHGALAYVAARYGLDAASIAGLSPDEEPSAARLAELTRLVRERHVGYILFEELASPRLADTIARETGAGTLVFDPIEGLSNEALGQGKDYLSVQRENLQNLRTALACR